MVSFVFIAFLTLSYIMFPFWADISTHVDQVQSRTLMKIDRKNSYNDIAYCYCLCLAALKGRRSDKYWRKISTVHLCASPYHKIRSVSLSSTKNIYICLYAIRTWLSILCKNGATSFCKNVEHLALKLSLVWSHQRAFLIPFFPWEGVLQPLPKLMYIFFTDLYAVNVFPRPHETIKGLSCSCDAFFFKQMEAPFFCKNDGVIWAWKCLFFCDCTLLIYWKIMCNLVRKSTNLVVFLTILCIK